MADQVPHDEEEVVASAEYAHTQSMWEIRNFRRGLPSAEPQHPLDPGLRPWEPVIPTPSPLIDMDQLTVQLPHERHEDFGHQGRNSPQWSNPTNWLSDKATERSAGEQSEFSIFSTYHDDGSREEQFRDDLSISTVFPDVSFFLTPEDPNPPDIQEDEDHPRRVVIDLTDPDPTRPTQVVIDLTGPIDIVCIKPNKI
jgi:hypothetical protein